MHDKTTCYVRRVDLRKGIRESVWAGSQPTVECVVFAFYSWGGKFMGSSHGIISYTL